MKPLTGRSLQPVDVMEAPDGRRVEPVRVQRPLSRPATCSGPQGTFFIADCATVAVVARHVDLAELVPEQLRGL